MDYQGLVGIISAPGRSLTPATIVFIEALQNPSINITYRYLADY